MNVLLLFCRNMFVGGYQEWPTYGCIEQLLYFNHAYVGSLPDKDFYLARSIELRPSFRCASVHGSFDVDEFDLHVDFQIYFCCPDKCWIIFAISFWAVMYLSERWKIAVEINVLDLIVRLLKYSYRLFSWLHCNLILDFCAYKSCEGYWILLWCISQKNRMYCLIFFLWWWVVSWMLHVLDVCSKCLFLTFIKVCA